MSNIKTGLFSRTLSTAKLSTRLGFGAAKRFLTKETSVSDNAVEVATQLVKEFDGMKGLVMKFGQMASYLGTHLPEEARAVLATLQSNSTAMPFEQVRNIIESELGQTIEAAFDDFDEKAFAAASIGQVHRARINGQPVAVKVQYPNIEKLLKMDLNLVGRLFSTFAMGTAMEGKALAEELRVHVLEECDYEKEAHHQQLIKKYCSHPGNDTTGAQRIPDVINSHSSRRVLTTEYVDGHTFDTFKKKADQPTKNKAALTIFTHSMTAIFSHCYFNGDPHPGNYLFHDDGSVTFLDFGCIKKFDVALINRWKRMAITVLNDDKAENFAATEALGLIGKKDKFDHDFHWAMIRHIYAPYCASTPFRYTHAYSATTNKFLLWENKNRFSARIPRDFLFINRLQWGMAALLTDLNAEALWSEPFQRNVYAKATPLFPANAADS